MESIKYTIGIVMRGLERRKAGVDPKSPEALLKKALTKKELNHIKFNYFKKGVLAVRVDSSTWLYYFSLRKEALLAKLAKDLSAIKDIRFALGEFK